MKYYYSYQTSVGELWFCENNGYITNISYNKEFKTFDQAIRQETPTIKNAFIQVKEYLEGKRTFFDIKLAPEGTDFQKSVWEKLKEIPYGETRTYKQIAEATGNPKACRAVGMANNRNPIAIVLPCHRVIGADGKLTGYAGGLSIKEQLIRLEKDNRK